MRYPTPWSLWTVFTVCIFVCSSVAQDDCFYDSKTYMGTANMTEDNEQCARWARRLNPYPDHFFPDGSATAAANYCRDPDGSQRPWCFTARGDWAFCNVSRCKPAYCFKDNHSWRGIIDWTVSGRTCQRWDSQYPHKHSYNASTAENYCRSPGLGDRSPWCYTTDPLVEWELCPIPKCPEGVTNTDRPPTMLPIQIDSCYKDSSAYHRRISHTVSGRTCQRWIDQEPHEHSITNPFAFPEGNFSDAANYCRDPNGRGVPWCYTTDPNARFEACPVPPCGSGDCFDDASQYSGEVAHTFGKEECMRWDLHDNPDSNFPEGNRTYAANFCRDPDGSGAPWCFTASGRDYCPVPRCQIQSCYRTSAEYEGTVSFTVSGRKCQRWADNAPHNHSLTAIVFPDKTLEEAENHCRDPDRYGKTWCFTTDPLVEWEECAVQQCGQENCWSKSIDYRGTMSHTISGVRCQYWASQYPHRHNMKDSPEESLVEARNHCRDPSGKGAPWCYTSDPSLRWEYCPVPRCPSPIKTGRATK